MKIGFSTVMYEVSNLSYVEIIDKAAALGYEGIELNFKEWPSQLNQNEIKRSLNKSNVEIAAIGTRHMYVTYGYYLATPNKYIREGAFAYIKECMKIARKLDCSIIQAGWAFQGSKLEAPFDATWRNAVESLKEIGKLSLEHGVCFAIEFACRQNAKLINTMDDALRILDEVRCEKLFVMADTFHIFMENDPLKETILKGGKKVAYIHLADKERLPPGRGSINFQEVINVLKEINYKGYMVMEFNSNSNPDEVLKQSVNFIKSLM